MSAGGVREGLTADAPVLTVFRRLLCRECRLSPREAEVVALLYLGVTNQQDIARELGIARSTVYNTLRSLYNKLDIHVLIGVIRATWPLFREAERALEEQAA